MSAGVSVYSVTSALKLPMSFAVIKPHKLSKFNQASLFKVLHTHNFRHATCTDSVPGGAPSSTPPKILISGEQTCRLERTSQKVSWK